MIKHIIINFLYFYAARPFIRLVGYDSSIFLVERVTPFYELFNRQKKRIIQKNLELFFGNSLTKDKTKDIINRFFKDLYKNNITRFSLDKISKEKCSSISKIHGLNNLNTAISMNKGVIIIFHHACSSPLAIHCLGAYINKKIHQYTHFRYEKTGHYFHPLFKNKLLSTYNKGYIIPHDNDLKGFYNSLASKKIVAISFDDIRRCKYFEIPFGGSKLNMAKGPFELSAWTGAPIVPLFSRYIKGANIEIFIEDPIAECNAIEAATRFAALFKDFIIEYPENWFGWIWHGRIIED